jgi:hypothetical protein
MNGDQCNNTTIVVSTLTPVMSELVQRLAFSFGYKWRFGSTDVLIKNARFLFLDTVSKTIAFGHESTGFKHVVGSLDNVLNLLKNPPKEEKLEKSETVKLPWVKFKYVTNNYLNPVRIDVYVIDDDNYYIRGIDLLSNSYKTFPRCDIVNGSIEYVKLIEMESKKFEELLKK